MRYDLLIAAAFFPIAAAISYGFAMIGEPQSVWLWCSILRAC